MVEVNGKRLQIHRSAIDLKVCIVLTRKTVKVSSLGRAEIFTTETMSMTKDKDTVRCIGLMDQYTKVSGKKGYSMDVEL